MTIKVQKMIHVDLEDFNSEEYKRLEEVGVVLNTDYDTREILSDRVQNLSDDLEPSEVKEVLDILNNSLGSEVVDMLLKEELDFVQVV